MSKASQKQKAYHLRKMRARMKRADVSGNGYLSREDYEMMGDKLAQSGNMSAERAEAVRKEFLRVADQMGLKAGVEISLEEAAQKASAALLAMTPKEQQQHLATCTTMYELIDTDDDGFIAFPEFKAFIQGIHPEIDDAKASTCFKILDENGNGEISREEFLQSGHQFMYGLDPPKVKDSFFGDVYWSIFMEY